LYIQYSYKLVIWYNRKRI